MIEPGALAGPGLAPSRRPLTPLARVAGWTAAVLALAILALAVVGVALSVRRHGSPSGSGSPAITPSATASATATPTASPTSTDPEAVRREALDGLLAARATAVRQHDSAAWLATVDPGQAAYRSRQVAVFANLAKLPLTRWAYTVVGPAKDLSQQRLATLGPDAWVAEVTLGYRFGSADRTDVHSTQFLTLIDHDGTWLVAGDQDGDTGVEIWDLGPLTVIKGAHAVVIGLGSTQSLEPFVSQANSAVGRVSAIWGTRWPRRLVVLVPKTQTQMGRLLGRSSSSLTQIAAVTTGELTAAAGTPSGGADQIIVNPAGFAKLGALGRRVVITHEATHVAVRASTPRQVSIWLSEGFADYVGYSGLGLPRTEVASDVLGLVRRGIGPKHLPDTEDFDATQSTIGPSYSAAWLACKVIADRYGSAQLLAFYRAAAGATPVKGIGAADSPDAATSAAFRAVLGVSEAAFTRTWLAYLSTLAHE